MTRSVLITGAGTGLGLETALYLARHGFKVYASVPDLSQREQLEAAAARCKVNLRVLRLDITDTPSIVAAVDTIIDECGRIDGLVNNAGISLRGYFEDVDEAEIRALLDVNLFGTMAVTRAVLPHMRAARAGRLVFISSIGGRIGSMARTAYCASKFGIEGFAESLMQEVAPLGIQVSIVEPGIVNTERWTVNRGIARRALDPQSPYYAWFCAEEKAADVLVRTSPTKPEHVAHAVCKALTVKRPALRYVVGWRASAALVLRRYLPGEMFERLYFGIAMRKITGSRRSTQKSLEETVTTIALAKQQPIPDRPPPKSSLLRIIRVLGLRQTLRSLQAKRFSNDTIRGYYSARAISALLNIGLLDELAERNVVNLKAFAESRKLNFTVLSSVCDYLYGLRILKRSGDNYMLGRKGRLSVDTMRGPFTLLYAYEDAFFNLEALLTGEKTYGADVVRRGEFVATGSGSVGKLLAFPMVADSLARRAFNQVLDLGCGDGAFLKELVRRNSGVTGYGIDLSPEGVAAGRRQLACDGLQDRVHLLVGDIFDLEASADQLRGIDAATCIYVLHEFLSHDREKTLELLRKFKRTFPGTHLVVCEVIRHTTDELQGKAAGILEIQFFHALSDQRLFSREEWKEVFKDAGFTNIDEDYLAFAKTAIFTVS